MSLVVVEALKTINNQSAQEILSTSSGTASGDSLVIAYGADAGNLASMPDATSSAGALSSIRTADAGNGNGHIKTYMGSAATGGAKTITFPAFGGNDLFGVVLRIPGALTVDDSAANFDAAGSASQVAPSVTTIGTDRLLVCVWLTYSVFSGWSSEPYTLPGGMTAQAAPWASPFASVMVATEDIPAAGSTGTRTATFFQSKAYCSLTIALAGAAPAATKAPQLVSQYGSYF